MTHEPTEPFERRAFVPRVVSEDVGPFAPPVGEPAPPAQTRKLFPILHIDDIELGDEPVWLIDRLLPVSGFGMVFGPPKSLKSFLLADALFHVAMGRTWVGRETLQGAIVYITAEGVDGFKRRLIAMRRHYEVEGKGVPFLMIPVAPDLGHTSGDAEVLSEDILAYLAKIGNPPLRAVAIDTLARTMKGADENATKDMQTFVDNCEIIGKRLGCLVIGVHHAGKDVSKGARGSNALPGSVDVMWSVEKGDATSTATIYHMKEFEAGATWQFRLQPMVLREASATTQLVAAAVVEIVSFPGDAQQAATSSAPVRLGDRPKLLLSIVRYAIEEMGKPVRGDIRIPADARAISREDLKRYLPIKGYWDDDRSTNSNRAIFSADLKTLNARKVLGLSNTHVWFGKEHS